MDVGSGMTTEEVLKLLGLREASIVNMQQDSGKIEGSAALAPTLQSHTKSSASDVEI